MTISSSSDIAQEDIVIQRQELATGQRLFGSTLAITFFSFLNIIVSFIIQVVLAAKFGTSAEMDAYLAATTLPQLVITVLIGSLNLTFIPVFVEYETKSSRKEAWSIACNFTSLLLLALTAITMIGMVLTPWLITITAPGFDRERQELAILLARILFPGIIFSGLGALLASVYYSEQRFALPSIALVSNSLTLLVVVIALAGRLGISSVALGTPAGAIVQCLFLAPKLIKEHGFPARFDLRHPGVSQIVRLMAPLVAAAAFYRATTLVDRFLASSLPEGSISYLGYAHRFLTVLLIITGSGLSLSIVPLMSQYAAKKDLERLRHILSLGVRVSILIAAPVTIVLIPLMAPTIQLLFERGAFDHQATEAMAMIMLFYSGALFAGTIGMVLGQGYYVLQDTLTAAILGILEMILYVVLCVTLVQFLSYLGLALAYSIVYLVSILINLIVLRRRLSGIEGQRIVQFSLPILLAAAVAGLVAHMGVTVLNLFNGYLALKIMSSALLATLAYTFLAFYVFKLEECRYVQQLVSERLRVLKRPI